MKYQLNLSNYMLQTGRRCRGWEPGVRELQTSYLKTQPSGSPVREVTNRKKRVREPDAEITVSKASSSSAVESLRKIVRDGRKNTNG